MNHFEENWIHAAAVLNGRAQPKARKAPEAIPTLKEWGLSNEGLAALSLLGAADREICVGYSETFMSRTDALVLKPEGMCSHSGVVGMAAAYTQEEPTSKLVTSEDAVRMAISYNDEIESEEDLVIFLRNELNEIAQEINEKALPAQAT